MAISAKQKQKKLAKKDKKRKLVKKSLANTCSLKETSSNFSAYPVYQCFAPSNLFDCGIGNIIITRRAPDGTIGISAFVVDVHCLGVKNALFKVASQHEYESSIKPQLMKSSDEETFENIDIAYARKLVEGAVQYAKEFGFSPHRDYKDAKGIFGNVGIELCPIKYTYGQDGKPYYVQGPNESQVQVKRIINQLSKKCGEGNYNYLAMIDENFIE